jgi:hypothetical protein
MSNNSINLLDYKDKIQPKQQSGKLKYLRIVSAAFLFIVSVSSLIFFLLVSLSPVPQLRKSEKIALSNLDSSRADIIKLALVNERTDIIANLINDRNAFDKTLSIIQAKAPAGVTVASEEISKGNFVLVFSSNSLNAIDGFLEKLVHDNQSEKLFSKINIVDLSGDTQKSGFRLTISLNTL